MATERVLRQRVLTQRELNRAMLARPHPLASTATIPKALAAIGGLQAQEAPSMYVGLFADAPGTIEWE